MITRGDVRRAIKDVRKFHSIGRQALEPDGSRRRLTEADAAKVGIPLSSLRTARQLAEGFDRAALRVLCKVLESQIGNESVLLGKSACVVLLRVPPAKRLAFLRSAISRGLSVQQMELEVAKRFGTRRSGGRPPSLPADEAGVCQLLERMAEQWLRLHRQLRKGASSKSVSLQDLAIGVRRALSTAVGDLEQLQRAATSRLGELQAGRVERKPLREDSGL